MTGPTSTPASAQGQANPPKSTNLEHALLLAECGFEVFPLHYPKITPSGVTCSCGKPDCHSVGKHPVFIKGVFEGGHKGATRDPDKIRAAWSGQKRSAWRRDCNIGIGQIRTLADGSTVRLLAIDIDGSVDGTKDGEVTVAALEQEHGPLPKTMEVKSGRVVEGRAIGGRHLIYFIPLEWEGTFKRTLGPGVDIKLAGVGYVAAPPSLHKSGQRYEWTVMTAPVEAPAWLMEACARGVGPEVDRGGSPARPAGDPFEPGSMESDAVHGLWWQETRGGELEAIEAALRAVDKDYDPASSDRVFLSPDLFKELHWSLRALQDWHPLEPKVGELAFAHAHQFEGHHEGKYFTTLWNYRREGGRMYGRGHLLSMADAAAPGWRLRLSEAGRCAAGRILDAGGWVANPFSGALPGELPLVQPAARPASPAGAFKQPDPAQPAAGGSGEDHAASHPRQPENGDGPTLSHGNPARSAQVFRETQAQTLMWANGDYLNWESGAYAAEEVDGVESRVHKFLKRAKTRTKSETGEEKSSAFIPINKDIKEVTGALRREYHKPPMDKPQWINGVNGPDPRNIISFPNGLLDVTTGVLYAPNPNFFTYNALGFEYDQNAPEPVNFLAFLESIFAPEHVKEAIPLLQKMFGYLVSGDTSMQKIFMIIGEPRSGKGTLSGVVKKLLGEPNYNSTTLSRLDAKFSMESMIGKSITVIPDAHVGKKADSQVVVEILKSISGEDTQSVERKWKSDWTGVLGTRLLILANRAPKLMDTSQALANRFVVFTTPNSFEGREDYKLAEKLAAEAPGILNWALQGLRDLRADGRFILPSWAASSQKEVAELGSTVQAFFNECCEFSADGKVGKLALYEKYVAWALAGREPVVLSRRQFAADLYSIGRGKITGRKDEVKLTLTGPKGEPLKDGDGKIQRVTAYGGILAKNS